jgi:hypothetical protein
VGLTADVVSSVALCMRYIRKNGSSRGVMRVIAVPMTTLRCVHQRPPVRRRPHRPASSAVQMVKRMALRRRGHHLAARLH